MSAVEPVRLVNGTMLAGVALAMGSLLAIVFPSRADFDHKTDMLPSSVYSVAYLSMIVKASPADAHTHLALVRQLAAGGNIPAALAELTHIPRVPDNEEALDDIGLDLTLALARSLPEPSAARKVAFEEVTGRLESMVSTPRPAGRLRELADTALQLERPRVAADFYALAAEREPAAERAVDLGRAGRWTRAAGDAAGAVTYYVHASQAAPDEAQARSFAIAATDAMQATGDVAAAADLAARLAERAPDDEALVERAARLAVAANRPAIGRDFGRRLLKLRPNDRAEIREQALRELAAGDPRAALPFVHQVVRDDPDNVEWREREARVAEWAGDPSLAMLDWLWLAEHPNARHAASRLEAKP